MERRPASDPPADRPSDRHSDQPSDQPVDQPAEPSAEHADADPPAQAHQPSAQTAEPPERPPETSPDRAPPRTESTTESDSQTAPATEPTPEPEIRLRSAEDVLARVPFALGFHPRESLVALAIDANDHAGLVLRVDVPDASDPPDVCEALARQVVAGLLRGEATRTLLVVYSDTHPPPRFVTELERTLAAHDIALVDVLRADGMRWWSLVCPDRQCCPAEGRPYDLAAHPLTVASVFRGEVALPDEEELRASIGPTLGLTRIAMTQATERVEAAVLDRYAGTTDRSDPIPTFRRDGTEYVRRLLSGYLDRPLRPTDEQVAWTSVFVSALSVRDATWASMSESTADGHVRFWREVARRAVPPYDVTPTALLAFAGWLAGNGPLARCALERVLESDPAYTMAHILRDVLVRMIPPSAWSSWATEAARIAERTDVDEPDENGEPEAGAAA